MNETGKATVAMPMSPPRHDIPELGPAVPMAPAAENHIPDAPDGDGPARRPPKTGMRRALPWIIVAVVAYFGARAALRVWHARQFELPAGIAVGNGRLEADEIDIDTKFAARVAALYVREGDFVRAGQALARMDTRDLEAERRSAQAQLEQAARVVDEDSANVVQARTQVQLAQTELDRYRHLRDQDFVTQEELDQRQQAYDAATAALAAMGARVGEAHHALDATSHAVELLQVDIADDTLRAPRDGRIQYRIANVGEVLGAGGKVFTMLDATSVYMDIYLPTSEAGRVRLGTDGRIVLDAYPHNPVRAFVSFLASEAQFTPKAVETQTERDNLMFRVTVRVDSQVLRTREEAVRTGLPGVAYVRLDSTVPWPASLQPTSSARTE
ncbi:MAG TPA: HlyD family efflux transporter periplasmic adaptor subunit [Gemmatimonadales bacterium]|nr:HlyD family efflux transporter periplasmic adaptor subunit [Gemmatimonadales bacterium]